MKCCTRFSPPNIYHFSLWNCRFIDVPIESCGKASPLRVALQATAPDVLMILLRHGANPCPLDGGISPVLAVMDKLVEYEESGSFPYQLVSCCKLLLLAIPFIELPYKVKECNLAEIELFESNFSFHSSHCCSMWEGKCLSRNIRRFSSRTLSRRAELLA